MTRRANIDFSGHAAEINALSAQESETLASQEYLDTLLRELSDEQQRLNGGFAQDQGEDLFGGVFGQQTESQWIEARTERINQLQRAIARHPLS